MIWEASRTAADARRALLARLVLEHRLGAQDPLHPSTGDWEGTGSRYTVDCEGPAKLIGVVIDPERRVLLDDDLSNNAARNEDQGAPRSLERLLYLAELLLGGGLP